MQVQVQRGSSRQPAAAPAHRSTPLWPLTLRTDADADADHLRSGRSLIDSPGRRSFCSRTMQMPERLPPINQTTIHPNSDRHVSRRRRVFS
jgi:hypothetical protein